MRVVLTVCALAAAAVLPASAWAADDEAALDLQISDAPKPEDAAAKPASKPAASRLSLDFAVGALQDRWRDKTIDTYRLSVDFRRQWSLAPGWRLGLSNRLDHQRAVVPGEEETLNSLRELYVAWQSSDNEPWAVDLGRLQWRNGPAFGFNPSDFMRVGSLRTFTTVDPIALRENRLGVGMLRVQKLWADGTLSLALAPKLANAPTDDSFDADFGRTNGSDRALLVWSQRVNERVSGQLMWQAERGHAPRLGANATVLFGDAVVAFAEWSGQRSQPLLDSLSGTPRARRWQHQLATGFTWSLPSQWAITLEAEFNGEAPRRTALLQALQQQPLLLDAYLSNAAFRQDNASRQAWMLYATRRALFTNNLDLTGLVRRNQDDGSWLAWLELRYHWRQADLALQLQRTHGGPTTEYGALPGRQALQLVGTWFF